MRGKGDGTAIPRSSMGITPAYAGKRAIDAKVAAGERDHPRVCGEKKGME